MSNSVKLALVPARRASHDALATRPAKQFCDTDAPSALLLSDGGAANSRSSIHVDKSAIPKCGGYDLKGAGSSVNGNAKAVQEAVADPSRWLVRNRETGQEVEAQAFAEALFECAARTVPHSARTMASPQMACSTAQGAGTWMSRRNRNNGPIIRRPTLLRPSAGSTGSDGSNGSVVSDITLASATVDPPSPLQQADGETGESPSRTRESSSLQNSSCNHSNSEGTTKAHSDSRSGSADVPLFRMSEMSTAQIVPLLHVGGILAISFSPSGNFVATAGADHRCLVFRVQRRSMPNNPALIRARNLAVGEEFSSTSNTSVGSDSTAQYEGRLIDEKPFRVLCGHVGDIVSLSWGNDSVLLTGSADGTLRSWHPLSGDATDTVYEHGGRVTSVAWDPASDPSVEGDLVRGGRFLTGCMDGKLRLFSLGNPEVEDAVLTAKPVTAVAFAPDGVTFVAGFVGGQVGLYTTEGLAEELTTECRRHGIRHSASQHARHATSPVRRLSVSHGSSKDRGTWRSSVMGRERRSKASGALDEVRVAGLSFRPRNNKFRAGSGEDCKEVEDPPNGGSVEGCERADVIAQRPRGNSMDVLVSTNDSRTRVLVSEGGEGMAVGMKLKGHNTDGARGRHAMARYSDDGEFVISGSIDGSIHVWSSLAASFAGSTSRRTVAWSSGREGHERVQVCDKTVAVPVALFAPSCVARSFGGESSRVIVTGDDEGNLKALIG